MTERDQAQDIWRPLFAIGLVLVAAIPHYTGGWFSVPIWFGLAITAGFLLPRRWLLISAPLPWLIGVGIGLLTGEYAYLGELWWGAWIASILLGVAGMMAGMGIRRLTPRRSLAEQE